jgi:hypothetical protein
MVAEELNMKETTVCRYFRDWKRLGPNFEQQYVYVKSLFKKTAPNRDKNIELFARGLKKISSRLSYPNPMAYGG